MTFSIPGLSELLNNEDLSTSQALLTFLGLSIVYFIGSSVYRHYFHPLAKFPGPFAAASSTRWLYKVLMTGHAEEEFERLHEQYQTKALRISPNELHISDPHQYKVIYSQFNPFPKHDVFYDAFNVPHSVLAETDTQLHKARRTLLKPFFSRTTLLKIEPLIHQKAGVLVRKLERLSKSNTYINVVQAVRCLIFDVGVCFSFAHSPNVLEEQADSFESSTLQHFDSLSGRLFTNMEWPMLNKATKCIPKSLKQLIYPPSASFSEIISLARKCIANYEKNSNDTSHPVIFDCLSTLPSDQKLAEGVNMLFASSDNTATSLTTAILFILLNPQVQARLVDVLDTVQADEQGTFPLQELEKLEFLVACVKEALRLGMSTPGRLPRVVPGNTAQPLMVDGKVVPEGTVVSISAYTMNLSEEIWGPDARTFNPDRWLQPESADLNRYFCSFSKGRRMCMGQNLASAEILIILAYLFKNFKLSLPTGFRKPEMHGMFINKFQTGVPVRFEIR